MKQDFNQPSISGSDEGPFTDDLIRHGLLTVQTQKGIIEYAEAMAQVLAEAGRASRKATGDSAEFAIRKWADVITKRALEIVRSDPNPKRDALQKKFRQISDGNRS